MDLVQCSLLLHTFIRRFQGYEEEFDHWSIVEEEAAINAAVGNAGGAVAAGNDDQSATAWRDAVAERMFADWINGGALEEPL